MRGAAVLSGCHKEGYLVLVTKAGSPAGDKWGCLCSKNAWDNVCNCNNLVRVKSALGNQLQPVQGFSRYHPGQHLYCSAGTCPPEFCVQITLSGKPVLCLRDCRADWLDKAQSILSAKILGQVTWGMYSRKASTQPLSPPVNLLSAIRTWLGGNWD